MKSKLEEAAAEHLRKTYGVYDVRYYETEMYEAGALWLLEKLREYHKNARPHPGVGKYASIVSLVDYAEELCRK